jgi:protein-tyrosine phosphatase
MLDVHTHILPGIDDGPEKIAGSISLAKAMVRDGCEVAVATPHLRFDHPGVRVEELAKRTKRLRSELGSHGVALRLVPGAEMDLNWALEASDEALRLGSYAQMGRYVLLETPYPPLTANFEDLVFRGLSARGYTVVLAHPERNRTFQREPARLAALVRRGVLLQVTAMALLERSRRSRSAAMARALVAEGMAHILASDAHTHTSRRGPYLSAAVAKAAEVSRERAEWMVTEAPAAVIAGESVPAGPSVRPARRRRVFSAG